MKDFCRVLGIGKNWPPSRKLLLFAIDFDLDEVMNRFVIGLVVADLKFGMR